MCTYREDNDKTYHTHSAVDNVRGCFVPWTRRRREAVICCLVLPRSLSTPPQRPYVIHLAPTAYAISDAPAGRTQPRPTDQLSFIFFHDDSPPPLWSSAPLVISTVVHHVHCTTLCVRYAIPVSLPYPLSRPSAKFRIYIHFRTSTRTTFSIDVSSASRFSDSRRVRVTVLVSCERQWKKNALVQSTICQFRRVSLPLHRVVDPKCHNNQKTDRSRYRSATPTVRCRNDRR